MLNFKKKLLLLLLFIISLILGYFLFSPTFTNKNHPEPKPTNTPKLTSQPYQELTIPYLRRMQFDSQVGSFEEISRNNNYISYLTNYTSDGLTINGLLTKPTETQPENGWPAVVFVHGYIPPNQYQTTERYQDYVNYLARNGLVVFKIDLRGHGDSQGNPSGAYYSSDYVIDTLNAYSALQNLDFVNPNQIGLWGHSMAGNIILRSLAAKPDIPAAVIWAGSVFTYEDFIQFGIDDDSYQPPDEESPRRQKRQKLFDVHGRFDPNNNFWSEVTPVNYLTDIQGAIQLHHVVNDNVVSIKYSQNLNNKLDQVGVENELFEYQQGGHNLVSPIFSTAMSRTFDFFNRHLN
jgi:dipeptidyl aminopeptidase/acylaminoacyl peptidase